MLPGKPTAGWLAPSEGERSQLLSSSKPYADNFLHNMPHELYVSTCALMSACHSILVCISHAQRLQLGAATQQHTSATRWRWSCLTRMDPARTALAVACSGYMFCWVSESAAAQNVDHELVRIQDKLTPRPARMTQSACIQPLPTSFTAQCRAPQRTPGTSGKTSAGRNGDKAHKLSARAKGASAGLKAGLADGPSARQRARAVPGAAPGTAVTSQQAEVAELLPPTSKARSSHSSDPLDMLFERMSRKAVLSPEEEFRVSSQARVRSLRALAGAAPVVRVVHARPAL